MGTSFIIRGKGLILSQFFFRVIGNPMSLGFRVWGFCVWSIGNPKGLEEKKPIVRRSGLCRIRGC